MIAALVSLKDYVPFFQTILVLLFSLVLIIIFRKTLSALISSINKRIQSGSSFEAGPIKVGQDLRDLKHIEPTKSPSKKDSNPNDKEIERIKIYQNNRGIFVTHILTPSNRDGYRYDIFVYLVRHKSKDFSDIAGAEFFFGHMWGNEVFKVENENGIIGISTSAYAPFLCTCDVKFTDGLVLNLHRYVDFEMKRVNNPKISKHVL